MKTFNFPFRNVVKSFYTASLLYDVLTQFGELSEEVQLCVGGTFMKHEMLQQ